MASSSKDTTDLEENDLFYFESDHLALKGNRDYSDILKTIAILEAQRAQAIKDIDKLIEVQKQAEVDPLSFIEKLKRKEDLGIPAPFKIAEIPKIDWHKYNVPIPEEALKLLDQEKILEESSKLFKEPKKPKHNNSSTTFNKPWSSDEQKKLEELLIKFPPEAIEMRRYKKIAEALGNRTVKQVMSRIQKYFLKLYNAGLPIPGRIPKTADKKRKYNHKHQRHNAYLYKPTTFFPDMEVPVFMSENDDDLPGPSMAPPDHMTDQSSTVKKDDVKDDIHLKIEILRKVKMVKEKEKNVPPFAHIGYKCDICDEDPIIGSRWHCFDCKQDSIDFCTDCIVSQLNSPTCHPLTHHLIPLQNDQIEQPSIKTEPNLDGDSVSLNSMQPSESSSLDTQIKSEPNSESDTPTSDSESDDSTLNDTDDNSKPGSEQTFECDKDYTSEIFSNKIGNYNYLDPNFLPE